MRSPKSISLTSSELGYLWTGYSINEMSKWYLTLFREQSQDEKIKDLYTYALKNTNEILIEREKLLSKEGYPIPIGFSESDIHVSSPILFSDRFLLYYLHIGSRLGLEFHSRSLASATRVDIRKYHTNCLNSTTQLNERAMDILLDKGFYWRTPTLPAPTYPEYIQKNDYLNGWHGDNRPINSMELANLYLNMDLLMIIEALCIGFAQTSDSDEIAELFLRGVKIAKKQYHALAELLEKDELPIPPGFSAEITNSKKRVLSDRIMVTHFAGLLGSLLSQYGFSLGAVMKHDLVATYSTLIVKAGAVSEKVTRLLIEKEWLEKVPGAIGHNN
ncbi:DUF3231 family protein [Metabacillus litoralis]|uniref:DUF3231 family protein n=1 Tax=Metabacillus TaxID=2675233 RepID=UPI001B9944E8|nr:DUF3231 family protein [Metabacillus litoralis]MCM3160742.1 DUF3231 family protein [Metabacillus litoralis]UHA60124.1 DUF3231 family protein [Metabacillus litoralis]